MELEWGKDMTVKATRLDLIEGVDRAASMSFLAIPYAAPPIGPLRWMPPAPPTAWSGTLDATKHPNRAFQAPFPPELMPKGGIPGALSEDMLYLNVHTPAADDKKRPVMVWIHGGGFTLGSANDFDPISFVEHHDVVVVCINYRLGLFGFLDLSRFGPEYDGSVSLGFQDQIAAIRWVADNIADYGGDPANITICGGSAGAGAVLSLLAAPTAKGLFHKAIAISPLEISAAAPDIITPCAAYMQMEEPAFFEHLKAMSGQELYDFQANGGIGSAACVDGTIIVKSIPDAIREQVNPVPLLVGCVLQEGNMLTAAMGDNPAIFSMIEAGLVANAGGGDAARYTAYLDRMSAGRTPADRMNQMWFDYFRAFTLRAAQGSTDGGTPAWVYTFAVPTSHEHGPTHGADVTFAFDAVGDIDEGEWRAFYQNTAENRAIAAMWSGVLVTFMRSGNPNSPALPHWPVYDAQSRSCMVLEAVPKLVDGPDSAEALAAYGLATSDA